ncbi:hypothetical protein [Caulobacter sp. BP25]|uniref:hypothetical protein n=1 Tax=Caulobacter sp. BP25 TaxID=2048900 RepID=UPI00117E47DD|nr:hypothetical protein [Caulobacter sp. BP25]
MTRKILPRGGNSKLHGITSDIYRLLDDAEKSGNYVKITNYCRSIVASRRKVIESHYSMENVGELLVRSLIDSRCTDKSESGKFIKIANCIDEVFMQIARLDENNVRFASFTYGFASAISLFSSITDDKDVLVRSQALENQKTAQQEGGDVRGRQLEVQKMKRIEALKPYVLSRAGMTNRAIAKAFREDSDQEVALDTVARDVAEIRAGLWG